MRRWEGSSSDKWYVDKEREREEGGEGESGSCTSFFSIKYLTLNDFLLFSSTVHFFSDWLICDIG